MAIIQPRIQYTQRSFEDLRQQLISIVQSTPGLNDKWTDFNESDLGMALFELWCAVGEELNFYLDVQANEAFLSTARQRKSVVNLCKIIAYKLDTAVSSEGICTFRWVPHDGLTLPEFPIPIPKYFRLATSGTEIVPFVTVEAATLPAGVAAVDVRVRQGVLFEEEFEADGTPNQVMTLSRTDIASNFGAIEILVGQGSNDTNYVEWSEAPNFIINSPDDDQRRFVVDTDHRDRVTIKFGDGKFGAIPPDGFTVVARYLSSLGALGNVGANTVSTPIDRLVDSENVPASLTITNNQPCVGGADRESIEKAKEQAPQELSALYRMVTRLDGDALINGLAGIAKAKVWGEHELPHPDIKHFNQMYITFLAEGIQPEIDDPESWLPTDAMKDLVLEFSEDKKIITTKINFVDPEVVFVDTMVDVYVTKTSSTVSVKQAVIDKLTEFFAVTSQDFSKDVRYSNLLKELDQIPNVEYVKLKIKRHGTAPPETAGCTLDVTGIEPYPDSTQWMYDEHDIVVRRHEICQLGDIIASDGTSNMIHYGTDAEPMKSKVLFSPHYQILGQPIAFDGASSTSPLGDIVTYQWNMGSRGRLMVRNNSGQILEYGNQPADNQTIVSDFDGSGNNFSTILWKFTERPSTGISIVTLTVFDAFGNCAAFAIPYEIRL